MQNIPLVDLKAQYLNYQSEIDSAIKDVLVTGNYVLGEKVKSFENDLARYCNTKFAIGVGSGTDALVMALLALGIGENDEVITSPFTFSATINAILHVGAKPVFVDIEKRSFNLDTDRIEEKITDKTKAIMPVHVFGQTANMDEIQKLCQKHKLVIIEDAAQAIGARFNKNMAGSMGRIGALSFYPSKNLGAYGDGGAVLTSDKEIYDFICAYRVQGAKQKDNGEFIGINSRLDEIQAAILQVKLKYLDGWNILRRKIAQIYFDQLVASPVLPAVELLGAYHTYSVYTVLVPGNRDLFVNYMKENGIGVKVYYPRPIYSQPAYKFLKNKNDEFPNCESVCERVVSLPCYPELLEEAQFYICDKVIRFYDESASTN